MSDETPPPLRLKPRARTETDQSSPAPAVPPSIAPSVSPPVSPATGQETEAEAPRLRLKPKLSASSGTTSEPIPIVEPAEEAPAPLKIRLKPAAPNVSSTQAAAPALANPETTVPLPIPPPPAAPTIPLPPPIVESVSAPAHFPAPPKPVEPSPASATGGAEWLKAQPPAKFSPDVSAAAVSEKETDETHKNEPSKRRPKIPHIRAVADVRDDEVPHVPPRSKSRGSKVIAPLAIIVIAVGGFVLFRALKKPGQPAAVPTVEKPGAPVTASVPSAPPKSAAAGPTPSATLNELAATPARAIAKAQGVISDQQANAKDRIETIVGSGDGSGGVSRPGSAPALRPREITKAPAPAATQTSQLAPGVSATTAAPVAGDASPAFRTWVADAKISGLFEGNPPRALINGRMVRGGQMVDETLAITFARIDSATKMIVFTDPSGATVMRKF